MDPTSDICRLLAQIYGSRRGAAAAQRILALLERCRVRRPPKADGPFTEKDVVLITYADTLQRPGEVPLQGLARFASEWFAGVVSTIHLLPFYPWSSDDGFSVVDFFAVDPALGKWSDVRSLHRHFSLMFDFVLNHISAKSAWFAAYLDEAPEFADLAIEVDPGVDLSQVVRPRALPLLTPYAKTSGQTVHVWTTFSEDQIDLNYKSLSVLERMVEVLLFYAKQGADLIRMDAVAYLWKEIGTSCIHLAETHAMVKLFRRILDVVAPGTLVITETNVPHEENIRYFGKNGDEAQLVYNFSLPPLLFHALARGRVEALSQWARKLSTERPGCTFFNFTASHDGIGVRPLEGILPATEIDFLIERVKRCGGRVSERVDADGATSPYELNITYVDAMKDPNETHDPFHTRRFLASQAVALVLPGVPGVYAHSLLGSRNWQQGVADSGRARSINREKLQADRVAAQLQDPGSLRAQIFFPYREMLRIRRAQPAFHPDASAGVVDLGPRVFAVLRSGGGQKILALTNVSDRPVAVRPADAGLADSLRELISGSCQNSREPLTLAPYQYAWLSERGAAGD